MLKLSLQFKGFISSHQSEQQRTAQSRFEQISLSPSISDSLNLVLVPWCNAIYELIDCLITRNRVTAHANRKNILTVARHVTSAKQAHTHAVVHAHTHLRFPWARGVRGEIAP
jgi:hypothetical protein